MLSESGEEARVRERAASAYLNFAQSHSKPEGWNELELERENILGALEWCHSHQQDRKLIDAVYSLYEFMRTRGYWEQSIVWLKCQHEAGERLSDKFVQANALFGLAISLTFGGDNTQARKLLQQSPTLCVEIENRPGEAGVLHALGRIESQQGNGAAARTFFEQALALEKQSGDKRGTVTTLQTLGNLEFREGNRDQAESNFREGLAIAQQIGDKH